MRWACVAVMLLSAFTLGTASAGDDSILPADRDASANWRVAGMLSVGGIPKRTMVCAEVGPLGSGQDDTTNIQNAVNACPSQQVVSLSAGTFTIAEGKYVLVNKGITLRGAGPGVTILSRADGARLGSYIPGSNPSPMIILGPQRYNNDETAIVLTADAVQGMNSVQVASTAGLSVGQIVLIDEVSGASWQTDPLGRGQIWASSDFRVVWKKHNPPRPNDDFPSGTDPATPGSAGCWFSNCDRPNAEIKQISAMSGNTITFDSPITLSYRVGHKAQLHHWRMPHTRNAGVENLTAQYADNDNIDFNWCAYCWAYNVENTLWSGAGFGVNASFRVQLEAFYNHEPVWPAPGGAGYNISLAFGSSEILIENGISIKANKVMVVRSAGAGSVVGYNYMDDGYIAGQEAWLEIGVNGSHMVGSHHMLFEGNYAFNMDSDDTHGNSIYHTFFRNYGSGYREQFKSIGDVVVDDIANLPGGNRPLRAAGAMAYSYWMSWFGNVLGTSGHVGGWLYDAKRGSPGVWMLGWDSDSPYPTDPNVAATAIRDGNFDYFTNSVIWASLDTNHALPNSLYLTRKPAFFDAGSGYTWPWVNPMGGTHLFKLPAKVRFEAGTPFVQP